MLAEMRKGLVRKWVLWGNLTSITNVKKNSSSLSWSAMVTIRLLRSCGVVDDQIRELFQTALATAKSLPEVPISTVKEDF